MLGVIIHINGHIIINLSARRIAGNKNPDSLGTYVFDETEELIEHRYGDGAASLGIKMLERHLKVNKANG